MRIAALYDIHGNLPALRAVLDDAAAEKVDLFVIGGDVLPGPLPAETLDALTALGERVCFIRGNGDREAVAAFDAAASGGELEDAEAGAAHAATRISHAQRNLLSSADQTLVIEIEGLGPSLFCHGSPRSDTELITTATTDERLRGIVSGVAEPVVICGHTHRQFDRRLDRWRVVNAGAVGLPYEGRPGAYWAVLGPDIELRRTEYDITAAMAELREGSFPNLDELLNESLIDPTDPDEVAAFFETQATDAS